MLITYPITHLNGFMYAVDKKAKHKGEWEMHPEGVNLLSDDVNREHPLIIASNDPSLGLLLLPDIEEDVDYTGFNSVWKKLIDEYKHPFTREAMIRFTDKIKELWKGGYKAAKAKKYSEEDMRKAFKAGDTYRRFIVQGWESSGQINITEDMFIQSLNPLPIAVEVEMTSRASWSEEGGCWCGDEELVPKVDENNILQINKWIYEYTNRI